MITIQTFSFRSPPSEVLAGFVFDCRMLSNPGREERFRDLTGLDSEVQKFYVLHSDEVERFLKPVKALGRIGKVKWIERQSCEGCHDCETSKTFFA